ncbi:hypothetical protein Ana3638_14340 [Anaerocolumna sedimenticola]|uniref:Nitrogen regulatory protein P-II n=1 Tax=Anaerocolumna sedimenticola TaxID=2696063 RepID=A0A6P1TNN6_9FIRM|nr:hypothetical protein [Anaerocolumna sedimenticola]QHQ61809.1 hypothetical protein Ana3638_14340 [Anaerocolumna sedimenticola]
MNQFMTIVTVPMGHSEKILKAACQAGANGGTVLKARGAGKSTKADLFHFRVEPEEEIVIIMATQEITEKLSEGVHELYKDNSKSSATLFVLPIDCLSHVNSLEFDV